MRSLSFQQIQARLLRFRDQSWQRAIADWGFSVTEALEHQGSQREAKRLLGFALDLLRPHLQGLGLRVSRLTAHEIEVIVPAKSLSLNEEQGIDEGVICSAAVFALKVLWQRARREWAGARIQIHKMEWERIRSAPGELRLTLHLSQALLEAVGLDLQRERKSKLQVTVQVLDPQEQMIAKVDLDSELVWPEALDWKDKDGND